MRAASAHAASRQGYQAAYDNLQDAIMRLSIRPQNYRRGERTNETRSLVDQALAAYRDYMQVVKKEGKQVG